MNVLQPPAAPPAPHLLDQLRDRARQCGYSEPDAAAIAAWCERFIRFRGMRHPRELGVPEVRQ